MTATKRLNQKLISSFSCRTQRSKIKILTEPEYCKQIKQGQ